MPKYPPGDAYPMGWGGDEVRAVRRELGHSGPAPLRGLDWCPNCDSLSLIDLSGTWWCDRCGQVVEERES